MLPEIRRGRPVLPRLVENGRVLLAAYRAIAAAIREERAISPASEWLVDNFHIVDEQIREIRDDLPSGYYRQLPKLAAGPLAGYARVYGLAWGFVEHTDSRFDLELFRRYVRAYQRVEPLTIGELWASAISLRLVLVENLRRLVDALIARRRARDAADATADRLLGVSGQPAGPDVVIGELAADPPGVPFAVQLDRRLREEEGGGVAAVLAWLRGQLAARGTTSDDVVRTDHQEQMAIHVTVRNVITSMRLLSAVDWTEFFESVSLVEAALRDGTRVAEMDFPTRDRYRAAVEELARGAGLPEIEVARRAVASGSSPAGAAAPDPRLADPGYRLISRGRGDFERAIGFRPTWAKRLWRFWFANAPHGYLATVVVGALLILAFPLALMAAHGALPFALAVLGLLALVPASELAISIVNRGVSDVVGPRRLPKLELAHGIPADLRTLVAVPTLLTDPGEIRAEIERLEVRFLGNDAGDVRFALVSDWVDAPAETLPEDEGLLAAARAGIAELNERYGPAPGGDQRFYLFHRRRLWNPSEGLWMGWERKRGKLHELDRLLRGATCTSFLPAGEEPAPGRPAGSSTLPYPAAVRYVVTLDSDTRLGRGGVCQLVGTMAHPLNHPVFDPATRRVVDGHGILQPRVTPTLPLSGAGTLFQRIFSGPRGIDPYAFAVSDLYQDLFDEGIYTGKGIYDLDAFERALDHRVPENALLSHDLFEGLFARAGLASDLELFEEYPGHYEVAASRQYRWARGDWQLLPWLLPRVPDEERHPVPNTIPPIGRWKMLDNLRRSLLAPAAFLSLVASWLLPHARPGLWAAFIAVVFAWPGLYAFLLGLLHRRVGIAKRSFLRSLGTDLGLSLAQSGLRLVFLAHQAWRMSDAVARSVGRVYLTRRHLLEWVPAAQAQRGFDLELGGFYRRMSEAVALAGVALAAAVLRPAALPFALPFVLAWALSPAIARWISLPPRPIEEQAIGETEAGARELRRIARRTWRYFETFAGAADHALPPDNFQEDPKPVVAHRTSPTNIGLYLLSTVAAADFGWIGTEEMTDRLEATLETLGELERFRGHLFNWYATEDLRALEPRYVSTVDSGNLAGHLVVLQQACAERRREPATFEWARGGLGDAFAELQAAVAALGPPLARELARTLAEAESLLAAPISGAAGWRLRLDHLDDAAATLVDILQAIVEERGPAPAGAAAGPPQDALDWARLLRAGVESHRRDLATTHPWVRWLAGSPASGEPATPALPPSPAAELPPAAAAALARLAAESVALVDLPDLYETTAETLAALPGAGAPPIAAARADLERAAAQSASLARRLSAIAARAASLFADMDFSFLFDPERQLFSIGYNLTEGRLDAGYYDLLASEARLASFIAIARGDVPAGHWFQLGRQLTPVGGGSALVSWSGSMFEYLMPELVMDVPTGSLLDQTDRLIVRRQIRYAAERGVPWGISEAAYNARDLAFTYQYSNFGVSGLGLKRGLAEDLVIAPYATALAAMLDPRAALANFARLAEVGARGRYGFYESLDYTLSRLPTDEKVAVVKAYMAHHQGMTIVALANVTLAGIMRARFHAEPAVQATELLLQERTPSTVAVARPRAEEVRTQLHVRDFVPPVLRRFDSPHLPAPRTQILSNGRYSVMVTTAGAGYSTWQGRDVTRWREDPTRDGWGSHVYLRDVDSGDLWSAGYQPTLVEPDSYEVLFSEDQAEIRRRDGHLATRLQIIVSAEDDAEVRQVSVTNLGTRVRRIEVTSYAELALAAHGADLAHPAFSKLFVETEFVAEPRRPPRLPPAARRGRGADLGGARHLGRGGDPGRHPGRDRPRALPRARPQRAPAGGARGGAAALRHRRAGARPGLRPAAPSAHPPRRHGAGQPDDDRGRLARDGVVARRQVSRAGGLRAHPEPRLDPGPGRAHPPGDLGRRGAALPAPRLAPALLDGQPARSRRGPDAQPQGALGALGLRHLGRPADRAGADRRARGPGPGAPAPARPRVLADEAPGRRRRDRQREGDLLHPGPPGGARLAGGDAAAGDPGGGGRGGGRRLPPAPRPDPPRQLRPPAHGGARGPQLAAGHPRRADRAPSPRRAAGPPAAAGRGPAAGFRPAAAALPARVLERPRRLRRRRPRVRRGAGRGAVDAGALDQRRRQSRLRLPRLRVGLGLHLGGQQPREPAHPVVERSGLRPAGGGDPGARRGERRGLGADGAADPRRLAVRGAPRPGLQPLPAREPRHRARPPPARAARGPGQDLAARGREPFRPAADALRHHLRRMGARRRAERLGALPRHRARRRDRRALRAGTPGTRSSPSASPSPTWGASRPPGPPTAPSSWAATAASRRRRRSPPGWLSPAAPAPGSTPAPPSARRSSSRPASAGSCASSSGRARTPAPRGASSRRTARRISTRSSPTSPATGTTSWAPCRSRRRTARSTSWSTAGCSTRRSPAASGRAPPSTRRGAPSGSATRSRTPWRSRCRGAKCSANRSSAPPPGSSPRATCSTGGIRRRARACARASRTTACGCRTPSTTTWR